MEQWAAGPYGQTYGVVFHCVCVDNNRSVSTHFGDMFRFTHVRNAWIPRRDMMPTYGQLGCSGFIIIGSDGMALTRATKSYNRMGPDAAFGHAEHYIDLAIQQHQDRLVASGAIAIATEGDGAEHVYDTAYEPGRRVIIEMPELSGVMGTIVGFQKRRFVVDVEGHGRMMIPSCNLAPASSSGTTSADRQQQQPSHCVKCNPSSVAAASDCAFAIDGSLPAPPSIGCETIDKEHEECTRSLNALLMAAASPGPGAPFALLATVHRVLENHFAHEEELAEAAGFGGDKKGTGFSPLDTHKKDHRRILDMASAIFEEAKAQPAQCVGHEESHKIAHAFHEHASAYDALLEGFV